MIKLKNIRIGLIALSIILLLVFLDQTRAVDNPTFVDNTLQFLLDHINDCKAYSVVANGLIYFDNGGKQIATYTDVVEYLKDGLEYINKACFRG